MTDQSNWSKDLRIAHGLTWRYAIALLLIATLSTAAWLSLHLVISEQKSTAAVVNVSGRQRMLSQRTALFSNLLVHAADTERGVIRQKLNDAIQLMQRSHHGLVNGDVEMGLPADMSPKVRSMYFEGDNGLNTQVETYIKAVYELLSLDDSFLNAATPQLHYITETAPNQLVVNLDRMVKQYQLEGEASVSRLQTAETVFWAITLLLLALEALLIFHPFVKHVKLVIHKLQQATEELQHHEEQLEETVKQRTADLQKKSAELQESEEKFRLISTNAHDGIIIISNAEQVIYWNPA
ncbi:MAG: diguanylate cyclase, partial [Gammaproteobacteria bacterium]|nr:diguanylate cyclase [Gammaproteobacteria bacterium]